MTNVVIASAARTAVGSFGGSFANTPAHDLGAAVLEALVERAGIDKAEVSETILGQVLTAAQGQNPARQAHVNAGLPIENMGQTAENVANQWQISRDMQDEFAVASQNKAEAAQAAGKFKDEILPFTVKTRKGETVVDQDEYIRHGATMEAMQKLRPAFTKDGSVTAANASGINDGAAAVLLMSAEEAEKRGLEPLARIASYATAGLDPSIMGTGPIPASRKALEKAGWAASDLDLVEANEAFAAQACAVNKDMGWDPSIVNVNGGAIAIGHPIGASGCRILNTLLFEMKRREAKKGLATLCIGGGMGVAMCLERP